MSNALEMYLQRTLSEEDQNLLVNLYKNLGFSQDLILHLYEICIDRNKKKNSYIWSTALDWYEQGITKVLKKGYWLWLVVFLAGFILAFRWSERVANYYTPRMTDRILSAGSQWLVALLFVMFFLTLMM